MKPNVLGGQDLEGNKEIPIALEALRIDCQGELADSLEAQINTRSNQVLHDLLTVQPPSASLLGAGGMFDTLFTRYNSKTDKLTLDASQATIVFEALERIASGNLPAKRHTRRTAKWMVTQFTAAESD
jgi:hypothetical protein